MTEVYFSKDDPQPGVEMIRDLANNQGWDVDKMIYAIEEMVVA